jgi:hypothetical protein
MRVESHSQRLIVLISHALITMICDFSHEPLLNVFNDWALIHSKGKYKGSIKVIILGKWVGTNTHE